MRSLNPLILDQAFSYESHVARHVLIISETQNMDSHTVSHVISVESNEIGGMRGVLIKTGRRERERERNVIHSIKYFNRTFTQTMTLFCGVKFYSHMSFYFPCRYNRPI